MNTQKIKWMFVAVVIVLASAVPASAQTSAANVSEGQFGANTGGGTYLFPGHVGIGTTTPSSKLDIRGDLTAAAMTAGNAIQFEISGATNPGRELLAGFQTEHDYGFLQTLNRGIAWGAYPLSLQPYGGPVGIGTSSPGSGYKLHVVGNAHVEGTLTGTTIQAHYQDIAEWVPAAVEMEPGMVVTLDPAVPNQVMPSARAYDTAVAGVVSAQPGLVLGVGGASKEQIATTGRVKVRVDARRAPIRIGDLLVSSNVPGTAMRSEPMDINGRVFHQPGTIIGKALESLESGEGEILVLLSLQ